MEDLRKHLLMSKRIFYHPHNFLMFALLMLILAVAVAWLFIGTLGTAFERVGFSPTTTAMILIVTFVGSTINIPLLKIKTVNPIVRERFVSFFGIVYRIPQTEYDETTTFLAVNVGGAVIPTIVSMYLLWKVPSDITYALIDVAVVASVTHLVARPVRGVGVVSPVLISPLVAAVTAYLLLFKAPQIVAYVGGVLGTLVGGDLSNLHAIHKLGAPVASIGGAGTFDGVFLSGIIAVLLA